MIPTDYTNLLRLHDTVKKIQQLSWRTAQIEKRFPIQAIEQEQVQELIEAYKMILSDFMKDHSEFMEQETKMTE